MLATEQRLPPGSEGLLFLPQLTGERCPFSDPNARGAWVGLTARHTRGHLVRAVVEGVTFTMRQILDLVRALPVPVERVRLGGGGSKSPLWRQLQADIYNQPVVLTNATEGPAYGAALLAGVGTGVWKSVEEACNASIKQTAKIAPSKKSAALYERQRTRSSTSVVGYVSERDWSSSSSASQRTNDLEFLAPG